MKKTILFLIIFFSLLITDCSFSQTGWYPPQRLTNGYVDRYPAFKSVNNTTYSLNLSRDYEFFVFVRYIQTYSQICIGKITSTGLMDSVFYLTSGNFLRQYPCISYGHRNSYSDFISSSLVLWETNENAKWDIYGKYYNRQTGWGSQFAFDNSSSSKSSPQCVCLDSNNYAVTYVKNGDIIFRTFNPVTQAVTYDTNLTATDTALCFNPHVCVWNENTIKYWVVTYEKRKPDSKRAIYFKRSTALPNWTAADTVAYLGDNYFNSFSFMSNYMYPIGVSFTSDRAGYKNIYATTIPMPTGVPVQERVFQNQGFNFYDFYSVFYPMITDYVYLNASAMLKKINDSVKVLLDFTGSTGSLWKDSTTICDTSKNTSITLGHGFNSGSYTWDWVLYNKDSANISQIWGRKKIILLGNLSKISNIVPDKYSLSQNYPNPFNPSTTIRFQIKEMSSPRSLSGDMTTLKVFDILGKEIATLVNEKLKPGEYEVTFNGSTIPSGVYFYKLQSGDFTDTKKLVLLK